MKQVSLLIVCFLSTFTLFAQYSKKYAVTVTVYGNKSLQLSVDGKVYAPDYSTAIDNKTTYGITDLVNGQHTFEVSRTDPATNRPEKIASTFTLRRRFDMLINVNANGSLELIEKIKLRPADNMPAMSNASFTGLLNSVKNQRTTSGKKSVLTNAFNNPNYFFSSEQVMQLLQQVNVESYRLELAKLSYRAVTDRNNFTQVYSLLRSQASKDELYAFVNSTYEDENIAVAMGDANFNNLYQTIQQQWPVSTQMNSLTSAFNNTNNYFTTYQASRLIQLVVAESNRLQLAKLSYRSITDPANFSQIYDLLSTQASKNELATYVANYTGGGTGYKTPMSDGDFTTIYQTIQQQWPVSTQMNSLTNVFNNPNYYFTTYQASRLIQLVVSESNRLQLAKLSYRSITDPANFSQIYDLLSTQASKNELATYVANYTGGGIGNKTPMDDADFNSLYQNIQLQFLPGAKMSAITNTFNNTSYYFTCVQAKKLIELVTLESNRLQLAKLSYRALTDRGNFTLLYDLLSSQASRDELAAYVAAYKD